MIIQHNIMALNSYNRLSSNNSQVGKNLEKLSSGYKINRAGDDAAGLAISEKMRAQITGLTRASQNAQDGVSLVQTAEGQLTEVHSMLNRMVDLATQSSNGTFDNKVDRNNLQKEVQALKDEINRIAETSNFNGIKLLDGSLGGGGAAGIKAAGTTANLDAATDFTFEGPAGTSVKIDFAAKGTANKAEWTGNDLVITLDGDLSKTVSQADIDALLANAANKPSGVNAKLTISRDFKAKADGAAVVLAKSTSVATKNSKITVGGIDFEATNGNSTSKMTVALAAGVEGITVDKATGDTVLSLDSNKTYTESDINALLSKGGAQVRATKVGTLAAGGPTALAGGAGLTGGKGLSLQIGDTADQRVTVSIGNMGVSALGLSGVDVSTEEGATKSIQMIKDAINTVSGTRADLGAIQNRLEHTINNLSTTTENMTAAESRIRDTDMAKEMMAFTKNNVLSQAAQAMLAQANQQPQQVLQLLR